MVRLIRRVAHELWGYFQVLYLALRGTATLHLCDNCLSPHLFCREYPSAVSCTVPESLEDAAEPLSLEQCSDITSMVVVLCPSCRAAFRAEASKASGKSPWALLDGAWKNHSESYKQLMERLKRQYEWKTGRKILSFEEYAKLSDEYRYKYEWEVTGKQSGTKWKYPGLMSYRLPLSIIDRPRALRLSAMVMVLSAAAALANPRSLFNLGTIAIITIMSLGRLWHVQRGAAATPKHPVFWAALGVMLGVSILIGVVEMSQARSWDGLDTVIGLIQILLLWYIEIIIDRTSRPARSEHK